MKKPVILMILDGYGINKSEYGNAVKNAETPNLDNIFSKYPNTTLGASGMNVGLPEGQMGNSEVGHTNIGAGRIVYQELTRISKSIIDGDFFTNPVFLTAINKCIQNNSTLHLVGLLSDGGVHSHETHLFALLKLAKSEGLEKVNIHCIMDGRDVSPTSGNSFIQNLEDMIHEIGIGKIATVVGRYYAMDRDNRWERVNLGYNAIACGIGTKAESPIKSVEESYKNNITDEFINPLVFSSNTGIKNDDSVIFFNFRPDRAREITRTFVDKDFNGFKRETGFINPFYVCMTQYDVSMPNVSVAFGPTALTNTFGEYISQKGLNQLRIAETEKYAHVTFFFNGGVEKPYVNEDRALISSPKVATYDLLPEMSVYAVTDEVLKRIDSDTYDVIILNFANCDMVGHTGVYNAAIKAVEAVDRCVGRIYEKALEKDAIILITADHGNAEQMYEADGSAFTPHTINPVPFIVVGYPCTLKNNGTLADIAPTMLEILKIEKPLEMTGISLLN